MESQKQNRRPNGFSLVEVMVTITIIAIATGLVGQQVMKSLAEAKVKNTRTQMATISAALDDFRRSNGFYPNTAQGLKALITKPTTPPEPKSYDPEGYLKIQGQNKEVPKDQWDNDFIYESSASNKYSLKTLGEDGQPGGENNAADIEFTN